MTVNDDNCLRKLVFRVVGTSVRLRVVSPTAPQWRFQDLIFWGWGWGLHLTQIIYFPGWELVAPAVLPFNVQCMTILGV